MSIDPIAWDRMLCGPGVTITPLAQVGPYTRHQQDYFYFGLCAWEVLVNQPAKELVPNGVREREGEGNDASVRVRMRVGTGLCVCVRVRLSGRVRVRVRGCVGGTAERCTS